MAHRTFPDAAGRAWDVWNVVPAAVERRADASRSAHAGGERRRRSEPRVRLAAEFRDGWLAFQSGRERRRLAPVPGDWAQLSDAELLALLERSTAPTRTRRLIE